MSSYHSHFKYLNKSSAEEGFIIAAFTPDDGETDSFLGMEQVYEDNYDGTKRNLYGTKYKSVATISITLVKADGSDFSVADNKRVFKWLTGARTASWLDLYEANSNKPKYSFYCTATDMQQYKLDARVVGITAVFTSIHPWAYSSIYERNFTFGAGSIAIDNNGIIDSSGSSMFGVDNDSGYMYPDADIITSTFNIDDDGFIYTGNDIQEIITNDTDDLYTYINLDMRYQNDSTGDSTHTLTITNLTLNEKTEVKDIKSGEIVELSAGQFITSYTEELEQTGNKTGNLIPTNRIFGDSFNFTWPRLKPGDNVFSIQASGTGNLSFSWRVPVKIGDCALDVMEAECIGVPGELMPLDNPATAACILEGYEAYNDNGQRIVGTIQLMSADNISVDGSSVTIPAGYYAEDITTIAGVDGMTEEEVKQYIATNVVGDAPENMDTLAELAQIIQNINLAAITNEQLDSIYNDKFYSGSEVI